MPMQLTDLPSPLLARLLAEAEMTPRDCALLALQAGNRTLSHAVHSHLSPLLLLAAADGDTRRIWKLVQGGANPDAVDARLGRSALQLACRSGVPWSCKLLLQAGAKPGQDCVEAAIEGSPASGSRRPKASRLIVQELLRHGAAPTAAALALAVWTGDLAIAKMLLSAGAPAGEFL